MSRTLTVSLVGSLLLPATLAVADEGAPEDARLAALEPLEVGDEAYAEDFEDGSAPDEVFSCGCGGETVVDIAYYELESNPTEARRMLADALRRGHVEPWQRGLALSYLAEAQLRLGHYRSAALNYKKALRIDPDGVTSSARVGLATALYLGGARARARAEAGQAADAVCSDRWAQVPCYAAQRILALTARGDARAEADEAAQSLRDAHIQLWASFDHIDARLRGDREAGQPMYG